MERLELLNLLVSGLTLLSKCVLISSLSLEVGQLLSLLGYCVVQLPQLEVPLLLSFKEPLICLLHLLMELVCLGLQLKRHFVSFI